MIYIIRDYLIGLGFNTNSIIVADSANGGHILVRVNLKPTAENKALIKSCIAALKARFDTDTSIITIDESVINPSRVWKIYGTISKKGDFTEKRPHRKAHLLEVPENVVIERIESLETLKATVPQPETPSPKATYQSKGNATPFDVEKWMAEHGIEVARTEVDNGITKYILKVCAFNPEHNNNACAAILKLPDGALAYKCQHNGCVDNDWKKLHRLLDPEYAERKRQYEQHEYENQAKTGTVSHHLTDMGNAERLIDKYGDKIHFSYERKLWLIWKGKCWKWDTGGEIMQLAHKVARSIYGEITTNDDEDTAKAKAKWAASSESNQRLCAMVAVAESMVSITIDQLDCDIWLLNCNNGTINLKTGVLQPHNPADLITRVISTNYNPDATSEEWVKFLKRTFGDKKELIAFCQRALGYSITGSQGEMAIFFCHGEGWNGKSTLLGACRLILGEYAAEVEPAAFMIDKNRGTGPNEAIASLYNVNFVTSTEIEEGQRLSTALLKRMTGGESLRCEHKFERGFNYKPRYKLWMSGNHEPEISDTTKSIKNRFKKVPFLFTISAAERVQHYDEVLAEKYSEAILAWLVKGCLEWQRTGLGEPSEVKEATQGYFDNQDVLHDFLGECCKDQPSETCFKSELYKAYEKWCDDNGDKYALGKKTFNTRITEKGFISDRGGHNKPIWHGLRLLTDDEKSSVTNVTNDKVTNVTNVTENPVTSSSRDNQLKLPENSVTKVDKITPSDVKSPKRLLSIDPCPVCGGENIGVWPDGTPGYYCLDCYPNFNEEPNF